MSEETTKYQKAWDEFQDIDGFGCLIGLIILPLFALAIYISKNYPVYENAVMITVVIIFSVSAILSFLNGRGRCPRCKKYFDYFRRENVSKCVNCKLPIYYGSSRFYDFWGTEQGNELAEKVKKEEFKKW